MTGTVGIIGTGHFAGYVVEGLHRTSGAPPVVLSPRNAEKAAELSARFGATVARDNQDVVDRADLVMVMTRPGLGVQAIEGLRFRADQVALCMVAGMPLAAFAPAVAPAKAVRTMAGASVAVGESPFVLYPDDERVRVLGARLGLVHVPADETAFDVASALPVFYAMLYRLIETGAAWCESHGMAPDQARDQATLAMKAAALMAGRQREDSLPELVASLATKGGLTERGLKALEAEDAFGAWTRAMDIVLKRIRGDLTA